jgi:hypothetical protein
MIEQNDDFDDLDETLCADCGKDRVGCVCYTPRKETCEDSYCSCYHEKYLYCSCCYPYVCVCEVTSWR